MEKRPSATQPNTTQPSPTQPSVTHEDVTHPNVTHQNATHPNVTHQNVTHQNVRQPGVTQRNIKARKITYYILGALEILFTFRLIFKVLGANPQSVFVNVIYSVSNIFLAPFKGIFRMAVTDGIETQSVLEPELLIAMASYAVLAWGIVKLIELNGRQKDIVD